MGEREEQGGMVLVWGRNSSNRGLGSSNRLYRTHSRTTLGNSKGCSDRRGHNSYGSGSGGGRRSSSNCRARVGLACRGRRGAAHPRSKVVSSACLHHGWAREGEEERMGWLGMKMKGGGGVGGFK